MEFLNYMDLGKVWPPLVIMLVELRHMDKDAPITGQCLVGWVHPPRHQANSRILDCIGNNRSNSWCTVTM